MRYTIEPNRLLLSGDADMMRRVNSFFSYVDKSAEYQLERFRRGCEARERRGDYFDGYDAWKRAKEAELTSKIRVYCCEWEGQNLSVPVGLFARVGDFLKGLGIIFHGEDKRNFEVERKKLEGARRSFRPWQQRAFDAAIANKFGVGTTRMGTGCGKTDVAQEIIRHFGARSIFLVPSKQILRQTIARFQKTLGKVNIGKIGDGKKKHGWVTVATYQSVYGMDAEEFDQYRLVAMDESHHCPADLFWEVCQKRLRRCVWRYGFTADEERADGGALLVEAASGPIISVYDAPEAIKDGALARPTFFVYEIRSTRGSFVQWEEKNKKRLAVGTEPSVPYFGPNPHWAQKHWVIGNDALTEFFAKMISALIDEGKNCLVLVDEKEHGEKFVKFLGDKARFVANDTKDNDETVEAFNRRELKGIVATSVLGEGADTISVDVLLNLMGGRRPKQALGRGLRNDPGPDGVPRKPEVMVIDVDFPNCDVLHAHWEDRKKVYEKCGEIFVMKAPV